MVESFVDRRPLAALDARAMAVSAAVAPSTATTATAAAASVIVPPTTALAAAAVFPAVVTRFRRSATGG